MDARIRTDQVGSLIRPPYLLDARDDYKAGKITRNDLTKIEDRAILEAIELQIEAGIDILTDGEMRRDSFMTGLYAAVEGFASGYTVMDEQRPDGTTTQVEYHSKWVESRLKQRSRITADEVSFMKQHAKGPFKVTMISPAYPASFRVGVTDKVYANREELRADLVRITQAEMTALAQEGVEYVQLDEGFAYFVSERLLGPETEGGAHAESELEAAIVAENECWDCLPEGVVKAMHVCRGNRTAWGAGRGSYDWVAERLFQSLRVDRFLLEYDSVERLGGFEPLRFVPENKVVVLGLVSTKNPALESQDDLLRRIEEASRYCSIEQLAISPQCGFQSASNRDGAFMTIDQQKRKLELIVETAQKVWR
jgi:5-methyltetrahydropteroyltriglutamate--homocysteine methyltransferase